MDHVIYFRHDVVVTVQVCDDAESSPFLLRAIHLGGQGAVTAYLLKAVRHQRIAISDQVGGNVECLTLRFP